MLNIDTCVILAGGFGSRITEETMDKPKPMVMIGNLPIIHHIMNYYSGFGIENFIICSGYKSNIIKKYFYDCLNFDDDLEIDFKNKSIKKINYSSKFQNWNIKIIDTGLDTNTGGRLIPIFKYIKKDNFFLTYGDGLSNINLKKLEKQHFKENSLVTVTAVKKKERFGGLEINSNNIITKFMEKKLDSDQFINGGFFVVNKEVRKYIKSKKTSWEFDVLSKLAIAKKMNAFKHYGFWQCMDNLREKQMLEKLYYQKKSPWII